MVAYQNVTLASTIGYNTLIVIYKCCTWLGAVSTLINICLLSIFFSTKVFRRKYHLLITLAIADLVSCLSILYLGIERQIEYVNVLATLTVPIRTSLNCAIATSAWMQVLGDVWPPIVQLILASERVLAVYLPIWYHSHMGTDSRYIQAILSFVFALIILLVGFIISYLINNSPAPVLFDCGRKAAFSTPFGVVLYFYIIIAYSVSFGANLSAYLRARKHQLTSAEMARQVRRIRALIIIAFFSVILISIPNFVKLGQVFLPQLQISDPVSQAVNCVTCVNCSIDSFVYFLFNDDFNSRVRQLLHMKPNSKIMTSTISPMIASKAVTRANVLQSTIAPPMHNNFVK